MRFIFDPYAVDNEKSTQNKKIDDTFRVTKVNGVVNTMVIIHGEV